MMLQAVIDKLGIIRLDMGEVLYREIRAAGITPEYDKAYEAINTLLETNKVLETNKAAKLRNK